ncbi:MAG: hypothetical protein WC460_03655 [Patescibacteria group bacterium]
MRIFIVQDSEGLVVIRAKSKEDAFAFLRQSVEKKEIGGLFCSKWIEDLKEITLEGEPGVVAYYFQE